MFTRIGAHPRDVLPRMAAGDPLATAAELAGMAAWLGLERVRVGARGDLGPALAAELAAAGIG